MSNYNSSKKSYSNVNDDEDANDRYKQDLRNRLNEIKNKKDRTSSLDDRLPSGRAGRQDYETKSSSNSQTAYSYKTNQSIDTSSSYYKSSSTSSYHQSSYKQSSTQSNEFKSTQKTQASNDDRKKIESSDVVLTEKSKLNKIMNDAELNEIISDEEESESESSNLEQSIKDKNKIDDNNSNENDNSDQEDEESDHKEDDNSNKSDDAASSASKKDSNQIEEERLRKKLELKFKKRQSRSNNDDNKSPPLNKNEKKHFRPKSTSRDNSNDSNDSKYASKTNESNNDDNDNLSPNQNNNHDTDTNSNDTATSNQEQRIRLKRKKEKSNSSENNSQTDDSVSEEDDEDKRRYHKNKAANITKNITSKEKKKRSPSIERPKKVNEGVRNISAENDSRSIPSPKSNGHEQFGDTASDLKTYITYYCAIQGCRSVEEFECLNKIEEGAYGVVYRAKDKKSNEVVALKRLKMEKEREGFPITSIREVDTLLKAQHPNVVTFREIVVGSNMDKIYMVMDYVEHDLKSLMQYGMKKPFMMAEVKTLMLQLLSGIAHLHDNWIIHRDLKTSNLLLSHKGVLKIADFGLAREYGSPLKEYTPIVVTLWYRSPELLLNIKKYSISIDMWSVGCIFGELMLMKALFPGKNEKDQLDKIFKDLGTPNDKIWNGFSSLPLTKKLNFPEFPYNTLRSRFGSYLSDKGFELINKLLTYDPSRRITAEDALKHDFFKETPLPLDSSIFPTWPAKSEGMSKNKMSQDSICEPKAPSAGKMYEKLLNDEDGFVLQLPIATGFTLR